MKVSILIPVYGVEQYIAECARSLFNQTYRDLEFIFVDDCSPDNSISVLKKVLEDYPDRANQVHIIRHETNKGLGATRHTAFTHATGDAILHVDSDDVVPKNAVSLLVDEMQKARYDIVSGAYAEYKEHRLGAVVFPPKTSHHQYLRMMLCQNLVKHHIWGRLYRRSFLQDQHIESIPDINYCEDYAVVPRAFFSARYTTIDDLVYYYRTDNSTSYTHQISHKNLVSMLKANAVVIDFFRKNDVKGLYHQALDMGLLNMYRDAMKNGMHPKEIETYCPFQPIKARNRVFLKAMTTWLPMKVSDILYRIYRRI